MGLLEQVGKHLPDSIRPLARKFYYYQVDVRHRNTLIPPKRLATLYGPDEGKDFAAVGNYLLTKLIKYADLKPSDTILDVGCGTGLLAAPLTSYIINGSYEGFDTISAGIKWCQKHISRRFYNFHFQVVDIHHKSYNPRGKIQASQYRFPYDDHSFDVVILRSIFTHLRRLELEHYLSEIVRVMKKNGRCFITYHLINAETRELMKNKKSYFSFEYKVEDDCYTTNSHSENELGYEESYIRKLYHENGLKIKEPILYGGWRLGTNVSQTDFQDIIVASK